MSSASVTQKVAFSSTDSSTTDKLESTSIEFSSNTVGEGTLKRSLFPFIDSLDIEVLEIGLAAWIIDLTFKMDVGVAHGREEVGVDETFLAGVFFTGVGSNSRESSGFKADFLRVDNGVIAEYFRCSGVFARLSLALVKKLSVFSDVFSIGVATAFIDGLIKGDF